MNLNVFRKVSLERLSSPEQLDQLLRVTSPKSWISFIGVASIIVIAILWGIFGSVPIKVPGNGILMKSGGLLTIQHISSGTITDIKVKAGDIVEKGEIVARITQTDLVNQVNELRVKLSEMETEREKSSEFLSADSTLQRKYLEQEKQNIRALINSDIKQLKLIEDKISALEELYKAGGITKQSVNDAKQDYEMLKQKISSNQNSLNKLELQLIDKTKSFSKEESSTKIQIDELLRQIKVIEQKLEENSNIISPSTGKVIEIMVTEGSLISPGETIMSLEPVGRGIKNLVAVIYVSTNKGKNIKRGMEVYISPAGIEKEEYGYILGRVTRVSEYPSTSQGMMSVLGNQNLVNSLLLEGPVIEVIVDLLPSSKTISGYKWTSRKGAPVTIVSGISCKSDILVEVKRPITLVIPEIKKKLLGEGENGKKPR